MPDTKLLGLVFVCPREQCSREAAASDAMWVSGLDKFRKLFEETIQMLLAVQRLNPLERYTEIEALATRAEWQPDAIFQKLRGVRLTDAKK